MVNSGPSWLAFLCVQEEAQSKSVFYESTACEEEGMMKLCNMGIIRERNVESDGSLIYLSCWLIGE